MTFLKAAAMFASGEAFLPRFRDIGDLTLDLFHLDGRVADQWLALQPLEFELLWRLARNPGKCLSESALMAFSRDEVSFEAAAERLRAKLGACGLSDLLTRHPEGCYCIKYSPAPDLIA